MFTYFQRISIEFQIYLKDFRTTAYLIACDYVHCDQRYYAYHPQALKITDHTYYVVAGTETATNEHVWNARN